MSVVTINSLAELDTFLGPIEGNDYRIEQVHIVIINFDNKSMAHTGLSRGALVKRIRMQSDLHHIAVIFSEHDEKITPSSSTAKLTS